MRRSGCGCLGRTSGRSGRPSGPFRAHLPTAESVRAAPRDAAGPGGRLPASSAPSHRRLASSALHGRSSSPSTSVGVSCALRRLVRAGGARFSRDARLRLVVACVPRQPHRLPDAAAEDVRRPDVTAVGEGTWTRAAACGVRRSRAARPACVARLDAAVPCRRRPDGLPCRTGLFDAHDAATPSTPPTGGAVSSRMRVPGATRSGETWWRRCTPPPRCCDAPTAMWPGHGGVSAAVRGRWGRGSRRR